MSFTAYDTKVDNSLQLCSERGSTIQTNCIRPEDLKSYCLNDYSSDCQDDFISAAQQDSSLLEGTTVDTAARDAYLNGDEGATFSAICTIGENMQNFIDNDTANCSAQAQAQAE